VLLNPADAASAKGTLKTVKEAAHALGLEMLFLNASTPAEIDAAFVALARERAEALFIAGSAFFTGRAVQLATLAVRDRIPASYAARDGRSRPADELWHPLCRYMASDWHLCRQHPQGCQARGPSGAAKGVGVFGFSNNVGVFGQTSNPASYAGYFEGNVYAHGSLTASVKHSVVPFPGGSHRLLHCMESPEHWFEDFGTGKLKAGSAVVKIDADFAKVIKRGYHVFLTPRGDCNGLYTRRQTGTSFEVRELRGGKSNVSFSYRIVGLRKDIKAHRRFAKFDRPLHMRAAARASGRNAARSSALRAFHDRLKKEGLQSKTRRTRAFETFAGQHHASTRQRARRPKRIRR
jgi:hypothetical protein